MMPCVEEDAPVPRKEMSTQTEPEVRWEGIDLPDHDGNCLMSISKLEDFIRLATSHSAECGMQLVLQRRELKDGAKVHHVWKCPCCCGQLLMDNCDMIRSPEVAEGAGYSRSQPDFNLRLVKGTQLTGINTTKLQEFMQGELGIKIATDRNLRQQITKVRKSISSAYEVRKMENRKEHVAAVRESPKYCGDVEWDSKGEHYATSAGGVCIDGAGCTRIYNNRHRGRQSAAVTNSCVTKKPLALVVSQVC
jgi:hypothetical protein